MPIISLVVRIGFSYTIPNPGLILKKILGHMERIQDLQIACLPEYMEQMLRSRITAPAPFLRSFRLSFDRNNDSTFIFSKDMFPGRMPNLRKVHLELCLVDWSCPIFSGLTELVLHSMLDDSLDYWLGLLFVLRKLPHLRRLALVDTLENAVDISSIDFKNMDKPISLP